MRLAFPRRTLFRWRARPARSRTSFAIVLQAAALCALALALLGSSWLDPRGRARMLVVVDRSASMPRGESDAAVARVLQQLESTWRADVQLIEFAGRHGVPSTRLADSAADLDPGTTNLEGAIDAALSVHARTPLDGVVVVSDGMENAGDTRRALAAARDARLPVRWVAVARAPPDTRIAEVLVPDRARVGQPIRASVQLAGRLDRPLRVRARAAAPGGEQQQAIAEADSTGRASLAFDAKRSGVLVVDVAVEDSSTGRTLDALANAAALDVVPRGQILYAQGSAGPLSHSLRDGGWPLDVVSSVRLDAYADALGGYRAVILDDVAVADASPRFWRALSSAVREYGVGLMALGGERSFGRGGYQGSDLESLLPVASEPAARVQPASVAFVVDKSGSMGEGSAGVDRFQLAQRAVLETARGLTERDFLSLVVFDVAARVLMPLAPARAATQMLARDWPVTPSGGTRLAPALATALDELERSSGSRRILVLVTDGFVDDAPRAELRARLERAHVETIALAVGQDADVNALERLVDGNGAVVRVDEAAELPLAMRSAMERRRARIERGTIAVTQSDLLPFAPGRFDDWPAIAAYAVARSRPNASVPVQTERGDPVVALQSSGLGRVVAVTCGLGRWTPRWMGWRAWPELAGGLADWISSTPTDGMLALAVSDGPAGLQVDADVRAARGWAGPEGVSMAMIAPTGEARVVHGDYVAAGRMRAMLPDNGAGLYTFVISTALGTQRLVHLRSRRGEAETWGTNPALADWIKAGLVGDWDSTVASRSSPRLRADGEPDRSLIALALLLFLAGVVVDRAPALLAALTGSATIGRLLKRR